MRVQVQTKTTDNPRNSKIGILSPKTIRDEGMMNITFHSYRGGTGKTIISANLALILALKGNKICLLDMDLRAPSLISTFENKKKFWINDYLNRICEIDNVLNDYTPGTNKVGQLFVGLANPSTDAIRDISSKDRKWEMQALTRLLAMKNKFARENSFDYVIVDTSPGLQYSSINNIVAADLALVITSIDKSDLMGTQSMIHDFYDLFEKRTGIIVNKIPEGIPPKQIFQKFDSTNLPIIELISCSCELLKSGGDCLFALQNKEHPFTQKLYNLATKIDQQLKKNEIKLKPLLVC